jgi:hypothetical protein
MDNMMMMMMMMMLHIKPLSHDVWRVLDMMWIEASCYQSWVVASCLF